MLEIVKSLAIPTDGNEWLITEGHEARQSHAVPRRQRLKKKCAAIFKEHHPCVSLVIPSRTSNNVSSVIIEGNKLPPSPKSKVVTISLFDLFKLFRGHPIVGSIELREIRHIAAVSQK
jgi:hypothetical protein